MPDSETAGEVTHTPSFAGISNVHARSCPCCGTRVSSASCINIGIKIYIQGMMETAPLLPCRKGGALSRLANRFERVSFGNKPNLAKGSGD